MWQTLSVLPSASSKIFGVVLIKYILGEFLFLIRQSSNRLEAWTCILQHTILNVKKLFPLFPVGEESARPAWKFKLGKNITRHYLPKGLTMLSLLTVIAILINEYQEK